MISDKDFEKLVELLHYKSPFIEIKNNYNYINLYSSILIGEEEYNYYIFKNNFEEFKNLTNELIDSIENIKNISEKDFKIENIFELKKYISKFVSSKNKWSPYLKFIDSNRLDKEEITEKVDFIYSFAQDKKLMPEIKNIFESYKNIDDYFSKENYKLTMSEFSNFIHKISALDYHLKEIFFTLQRNNNNNDIAEKNAYIDSEVSIMDSLLKDIKNMFNDKNNFINEFVEDEFKDAKKFSNFINLKDKLDQSYNVFYNKCKKSMKLSNFSDLALNSKGNIKDFIQIKLLSNSSVQDVEKTKIDLTGSKYSSIEIFQDNSLILTQRDGIRFSCSDTKSYYDAIMDVVKNEFNEELKNLPMISKKFNKELNSNFKNINSAKLAIETFLKYKGALKSSGFDIVEYFDKYDVNSDSFKNKFFENLDDKMNAIVKEHKVKKFAESIISNKYIHLYDENSYKIFTEILDSNVNKTQLQNLIGKKIALYKDTEEFNKGLKTVLEKLNGFYLDIYLGKVSESNVKIISNENEILIIQVNNFEQSKKLGSPSWCISRDKRYFDSYTSNKQSQFFVYNFNLEPTDENSMIGITLSKNNDLYACHSKFDKEITIQTDEIARYKRIIEDKINADHIQEGILKESYISNFRNHINTQ